MNTYFGLLILAILILTILLFKKTREQAVGICATALDQTVRKNTNKEKALAFIRERGEVTNQDIRNHFGVSVRTAVRYMDDLEREGAVEQVGSTGRSVVYRIKS
ncbi:hypothetical protein BK004_02270 [bacterium CG10_46_32]|nr:MAG: hypothetical protein BK004_02270 [bacterium CG10_46_32]PIR56139.1 MAG: hypothetical protein COU73_02290 [Parcubacteria group bacterium CG10_big_fil_rev_8_21_14_0_10_46_32]